MVDSVVDIGGASEDPDLIRGSVDTEDTAAKPNRPSPEVIELPVVMLTAAEILVEAATSLELPD